MVAVTCVAVIVWGVMPEANGGEKDQTLVNGRQERLSGTLQANELPGDVQNNQLSGSLKLAQAHGAARQDQLSGNLQVDLFGLTAMRTGPDIQDESKGLPIPSHKSPWLAGGMSLVIPGSGEFYAESYWKAALFFVVDVAAWVLAYTYDKKGDQQTDSYQGYANENWSVVQYAQYTQDHLVQPGKVYNWRLPGTEGMSTFDRPWIQVDWNEINRMERDIGGYYSHTLPPYNEQQYYELIGKYPQFNQGWRDANLSLGSDYETIKSNLTPMFTYYSGERGTANDYYATATTWVTVAVINHILSAVDAAWSAGQYNSAHASVGMRMVPTGTGYEGMAVFQVKVSL